MSSLFLSVHQIPSPTHFCTGTSHPSIGARVARLPWCVLFIVSLPPALTFMRSRFLAVYESYPSFIPPCHSTRSRFLAVYESSYSSLPSFNAFSRSRRVKILSPIHPFLSSRCPSLSSSRPRRPSPSSLVGILLISSLLLVAARLRCLPSSRQI
jgi:hypothetical protein